MKKSPRDARSPVFSLVVWPFSVLIFSALFLTTAPATARANGEDTANATTNRSANPPRLPLHLDYSLYASGLDVVSTTVTFDLAQDRYAITAITNTRGIWRTLVPWSNVITARGLNTPAGIAPQTARYDTLWREKPKTVEMTFTADGSIRAVWTPPNRPDSRKEATPEQLRGAMDPLSAVAAVLAKGEKDGCSGKIPAFDGRRLYNLVFTNTGTEELKRNRYSLFEGEATRCEITFEPLAGFPVKEKRRGFWNAEDNAEKRNPLIIWLADDVRPNLPTLPVRVQSTTQLGTLVAHLRSITEAPPPSAIGGKK